MCLDEIESRWRRASAGPWTVETAKEAKIRYPDVPREQQIRTFEDAQRTGMCRTLEEYIQLLEEGAWAPLNEDALVGERDSVTPCPPRQLRSMDALESASLNDWLGSEKLAERLLRLKAGADPDDPTLPKPRGPMAPRVAFWVSEHARSEDVEFIRCAAKDVGDLLSEVARLRQMVRDMGGDPS